MQRKIRWGILGAGRIAYKFAQELQSLPKSYGIEIVAVGSRSREKANSFGEQNNIAKRYSSYRELIQDADIDVIYVATPHSFHKEHSIASLNAGKAVLCEKPLAINKAEAVEIITLAREKKLFLMEAMKTRFFPAIMKVKEILEQGIIGEIKMVRAEYCYVADNNPEYRHFNSMLAGGALLDVGIYPISFASMVFGKQPIHIKSIAHIGKTNIDEQAAMVFSYEEGEIAALQCSITAYTPGEAYIVGTRGYLHIPQFFWRADCVNLYLTKDKSLTTFSLPPIGSGFSYQAIEVAKCLRKNLCESASMPLDESLAIISTLDAIREDWK